MATVTKTIGRLKYIEPNDLAALYGVKMANGKAINSENSYVDNVTWDPEDMNMSVDLQVVMPNREDCGQISFNDFFAVEINNDKASAIGRYVSFLQGSGFNDKNGKNVGNELTTSYTDASYIELRNNNESNKECVGIESIDITFDSHFYPQVNIKFIDVRGYSLMMPTEDQYREGLINKQSENSNKTTYNNFFRALFRFPYPRFLLTIKGYYGNHITFMLAVNEFKNNFNSSTGNFEVNVSFIGYVYGLYTDLPFNFLICAPYYRDGSQEEGGDGIREYWEQFHFDDGVGGEGNKICTFIEFLKLFDELNKGKKDIELAKTNNQELNNAKILSDKVEAAKKLVEDIHLFINDIIKSNTGFKYIKHLNDLKQITQLLVIGNSTNDKVYFNKDKYNEIVERFNSFVDGESILDISVDSNYTIKSEFRNPKKPKYFQKSEDNHINLVENIYFDNNGDKIIKKKNSFELDEEEDVSDIFSKFESNSNRAKKGVQLFYFDSVITVLNDYVTKANNKINENKLGIEKIVTDIYIEALGFDPSIQNVFRMIFAHIDCFMDEFYTLLSEIQKSKRKLSDIGITNKNLTDLNKNSTENCFVPPFTAFYKVDENRRVEIYPGELAEGKNLQEVEFIENFLSGALSAKNTSKEYILNAYNNKRFEDENKTGRESTGIHFTISSLSDSNFNGVNPYSYYDEQPTEQHFLGGLLYYFALRYAQSKFQFGDNITLYNARIEADNFLKLHQNVPSEIFKKTIEKYSGDEKDNLLFDVLFNFNKNRNNLVCDLVVYKDNVKISKSKLPLFTKGIFDTNNSEKVLFSEKDNSKKLFDVWSPASKEDVVKVWDSTNEDATEIQKRIDREPSELNGELIGYIEKGDPKGVDNILLANYYNGDSIAIYDLVNNKIKGNKERAAYFLYCLMYNEIKEVTDFVGTFTDSYREITLSLDLNKTGIYAIYDVTSAFIGAILSGMYGNAKSSGTLYFHSDNSYFKDVFLVNTKQYNVIKNKYSQFFIDSFNDFVEKTWVWLNKRLIPSNFETKDNGDHVMKDDLRTYIVENLLKEKYRYIYNVCDEYSGNTITIPLSEFKAFVSRLNDRYSTVKSAEETVENDITEADISNSYKLEAYNAMKNIYDKWANSYGKSDFELRPPSEDRNAKSQRYVNGNANVNGGVKEYDNFVFIDSFYNDISYRFRINPSTMYDIIVKQMTNELNYSVYEFMAEICQQNKLLFLALPVLNNFYDEDGLENIFKPQPEYMMDKGFGSTYVCMYTYEVSHVVEDESQTGLCDDGLDIAGITEDAGQTDVGILFNDSESGMPLSVPAFGVTYARQNQQYFRNISVNMDNPRVTDYSIANLFELANFKNDGTLEKTHTVSNDIYSIYANRSYNCSVEMLGCVNIMPMMYFQLNNIPMFRGGYIITNVEHHIKAGNFTTTFTGVRISKNQLPYNDTLFEKINFDFRTGYDNDQYRVQSGGSSECTEFDVVKAVSSMGDILTFEKCPKGVIPIENPKSFKGCVKAVQHFVKNGLGGKNVGRWGNGYRGGYGDKPAISYCGFEHVYSFPAHSTFDELNILSAKNCKAGDVAFMHRLDSETDNGHVCMYNGEEWVSDFKQKCVYVYIDYESDKKTSREIKVFRHKSCNEANDEQSDSRNTTNNGNVYSGKCNNIGYYPRDKGRKIQKTDEITPYKLFGYKNYTKMTAFEAAKLVIKSLKGNTYFGNSDKSIIRIISMYNAGVTHPSKSKEETKVWCYIDEAVKYLNNNINGANLTYMSSLPNNKEYICMLLEFISRREHGINTKDFVREAYDQVK